MDDAFFKNNTMKYKIVWLLTILIVPVNHIYSHFKTTKDSPIHINSKHELEYKTESNGDRVPDYSYCGYMASETSIPNIPIKVVVAPLKGDATQVIQNAIDYVSSLPLDKNGFRGTVLLEKGLFHILGSLKIQSSGVILRGSGCKQEETVLIGEGDDRETLIRIVGDNNKKSSDTISLSSVYFPVNTTHLTFDKEHPYKVDDQITINRPSTKEWLEFIGTDKIGQYVDYPLTHWEPGDFDINWQRKVIDVTSKSITIDVPLTNSLDPKFGGGSVSKYQWEGRINNIGIENLCCISTYDPTNNKDENHRWMAITMENVTDAWVRRVETRNFVSSSVAVWETASRITIEDCKSLEPIGEIGNYRRYSFQTLGQQILFQRCYAEYGYHAFSVGFTTPGPNAFVQCYSFLPYNFSGSTGGWANGILFDNMTIDGGNICLGWRDVDGQGGGWTSANSLCWSSRVAQIHLGAPPTAINWAYASWAQGYGKGHHELQHTFVTPKSLYYAQLKARTRRSSEEENKIYFYNSNETTAPSPELSTQASINAMLPDLTMKEWIDTMITRYPIKPDLSEAKYSTNIKLLNKINKEPNDHPISISNGWINVDGKVITGKRNRTSMWRGSTRPSQFKEPQPNLVRYVPGRIGYGLTDDLDSLIQNMKNSNSFAVQHYPALWYERRRDDHARYRRVDADVWAPFYEQPFSRSGIGEAWDRLSKYDLNQWNTWYWIRLKQFADLADENGLVFIHEHFLQHNIIEEGAHWADYPWRSANNINNLGFPEPTHYAGDKRVYMAKQFYDITNETRRKYLRKYIRKCLDESIDNSNTIHHLGWEYTGPIQFVQFWLDVINEWQKENNKDVLVMLPGTKDVQDSILKDPSRSKVVDIIDIIQWQNREDGTIYAPIGGQSLATRQYARIMDVGETSFNQVYRAVNEMRKNYPNKAVVYSRRLKAPLNWASFMAGGSFSSIPPISDNKFAEDVCLMKPIKSNPGIYILGKKDFGYLIYSENIDLNIEIPGDTGMYRCKLINTKTGEITIASKSILNGQIRNLDLNNDQNIIWLYK